MAIDGIRHKSSDNYNIFYVDTLSEHLIDILRADLASICFGPRLAGSTRLHTYKGTIKEFCIRYNNAAPNTKTGVLGELLAHVVIRHSLPDLQPISILLNPIERSIKKGFDLNFVRNSEIWYGEVKSSRSISNVDSDNKSLLLKAKTTLTASFASDELRLSLWNGACNEAAIMFDSTGLEPISNLLDSNLSEIQKNAAVAANVVLISVPFHSYTKSELNEQVIAEYLTECNEEGLFKSITFVCIQKSVFSGLENFIRVEAENS